jgi:hypothetical protein
MGYGLAEEGAGGGGCFEEGVMDVCRANSGSSLPRFTTSITFAHYQ